VTAQDNETFLGRWSRLKREEEKKTSEPAVPPADEVAKEAEAPPPLPSMETLTPQSDFSAFMHPKVLDSVRRVALKKLFADPHFNVMDGLDVYIDDYSKPDPIPPEMLRKLASAKFLKLFDDEEEEADKEAAAASSAAAAPAAEAPAASDALPPGAETASAPSEPDATPAATDPAGPAGSPPGPAAAPPGTIR
jgi:hypothetical protein